MMQKLINHFKLMGKFYLLMAFVLIPQSILNCFYGDTFGNLYVFGFLIGQACELIIFEKEKSLSRKLLKKLESYNIVLFKEEAQ
jgi:hypothetical protein